MALLDRYLVAPLVPQNPYADPPEDYTAPNEVVNPETHTLLRDENGLWRRDLVPSPSPKVLAGMERVRKFVGGEPNTELLMDTEAKNLFRLVDSKNWR